MRVDREQVPWRSVRQLPVVAGLVLWAACSGMSSDDSPAREGSDNSGPFPGSAGSTSGTNTGNGAGTPVPPPETEKESSYRLPVQSGRWVWSANPLSGRVAAIDTRTRSVELASAGFAPTYLAALRAEGDVKSAAIVLNARSHDASLLRLSDAGISVETVSTHAGANAWAVSPTGRFALAWSDATAATKPDPIESFQDVTVIDTTETAPVATRLSVGYRPSRIFYDSDEQRAFVVSQAGISVIELGVAAPFVSRDIALARTGSEKPVDVSVVPDQSLALFRVEGSSQVSFVELVSGRRVDVTLSGPVTDLDLVADGSSAIAVVRERATGPDAPGGGSAGAGGFGVAGEGGSSGAGGDTSAEAGSATAGETFGGATGAGGAPLSAGAGPIARGAASEVVVLPLPGILANVRQFDRVVLEDFVGSVAVSETGNRAVLYTTALALDRVTLLSTDPEESSYLAARRVRVRAPVEAVFIAPDAGHSVIALKPIAGGALSGFAVVSLIEELPATIKTAVAPITGVVFGPAPSTSALLTAATARTVYVVRLPERQIQALTLSNLPLAAGIVAEEGLGYVAQKHADGQLTLVTLSSGEQRTLTGFELAGEVIDGN